MSNYIFSQYILNTEYSNLVYSDSEQNCSIDYFYLDFVIDLNTDKVIADYTNLEKLLGPVSGKLFNSYDLFLRFTAPQDRINLINIFSDIAPNKLINCVYRWQVPGYSLKILEVRAYPLNNHQIKGVIIDQTNHQEKFFPAISNQLIAQLKKETYLLFDHKARLIYGDLDTNLLEQLQLTNSVKTLLGTDSLNYQHYEKFSVYKVFNDSISYNLEQLEKDEKQVTVLAVIYLDINPHYKSSKLISSIRKIIDNA